MNPQNPLYPIMQYVERLEQQEMDSNTKVDDLITQNNVLSDKVHSLNQQVTDLQNKNANQVKDSLAIKVMERAFYYMGKNIPYKFGAELSNGGFDCSSFMQQIFGDCGISLPRTSRQQSTAGSEVSKDESIWLRGDILLFDTNNDGTINHVGMYLGNQLIIHTATPYTGIIVRRWKDYYENNLVTIRRVL